MGFRPETDGTKVMFAIKKPRLLIYDGLDLRPTARAVVAEVFDVEMNTGHISLPEAFEQYDAIWTRLGHRVSIDSFGMAVKARCLAIPMTGLAHIDEAACFRRGIRVLSLRGETEFLRSVRATAELTIGLLLAVLRDIPRASAEVRSGVWARTGHEGREISGKTVGLIGVGRLGLIVGEYIQAFGGRPIGFDPAYPEGSRGPVRMLSSLAALVADADIISVHADLNPTTRRLIDGALLARLKPGAVLVNTSRGEIVDSEALIAALQVGRLRGAAVDVLDTEPDVRPDHPLVRYAATNPCLLVTPHIGGFTSESVERTEIFIAHKLVAAWLSP